MYIPIEQPASAPLLGEQQCQISNVANVAYATGFMAPHEKFYRALQVFPLSVGKPTFSKACLACAVCVVMSLTLLYIYKLT